MSVHTHTAGWRGLRPGHRGRLKASVLAIAVAVALPGGGLERSGQVARAAGAAPLEPARAKVTTALLDETVRRLLPVTLSLPAPAGPAADGGVAPSAVPATLVELRYCGPTAQGTGKFRAAIRLSGFPAAAADPTAAQTTDSAGNGAPSTPLIGDGECKAPLGDLGRRAAASLARADMALVLADLEASWHAWEIRVSVTRFVVAGEPRGVVGWGDARRDVVAFSTAGLVVPTELGPLVFHVSPLFASDGIELAASLGESGSSPPLSAPSPLAPSAGAFSTDPVANAVVELPFSLANRLLHAFTARPLPVRVGRETFDVQNASVRGGAGTVAVTALASSRTLPESARVTVTASGDDLRVGTVHGDAQLENCAGLGMIASVACSARNAARNAAATALGTSATERYRGQLLRELAGPQELHLGIARRDLKLTGELLRIAATARGLVVGARLIPGEAAAASP
jgi:hypothetical protein